MENLLRNIIVYIFKNYPNPLELSKPRLVKIIYLIDWKNCIEHDKQTTPIQWYFNHYGPYVDDIINYIKSDTDTFNLKSTYNIYGGVSHSISLKEKITYDNNFLPEEGRKIIDFVIEKTFKLNWSEFISLIYSTYPISTQPKYTYLDLKSLSLEYKKTLKESTLA